MVDTNNKLYCSKAEDFGLSSALPNNTSNRNCIVDKVSSRWHRILISGSSNFKTKQKNGAELYKPILDQLKCILMFLQKIPRREKKQSSEKDLHQDHNHFTSVKIHSLILPMQAVFYFMELWVLARFPYGKHSLLAMF